MPTPDNSNRSETAAERNQGQESSQHSVPSAVRERRVDQYEREELENPEAFQACLAAIQADQIRIGFALGAAVKQLLTGAQASTEHIREVEPSISIYLRVTRQIERFRQLELRQAELQHNGNSTHVHTSDLDDQLDATAEQNRKTAK